MNKHPHQNSTSQIAPPPTPSALGAILTRFSCAAVSTFLANVAMLSTVYAQDTGVAYFALMSPNFPCATALTVFDGVAKPALATLYGTFGTDDTCLKKWFEGVKNRPHTLEIHLSNEACRRNKRCEPDELLAGLSVKDLNVRLAARDPEILAAYRARTEAVKNLITPLANASGEFIISTGLEDNYTQAAYQVAFETIKGVWPYKIVRSPVGPPLAKTSSQKTGASSDQTAQLSGDARRGGADYLEDHGAAPTFAPGTPCITNLDGQDMTFPHRPAVTRNQVSWANVQRFLAENRPRCRVSFVWSAPWQGIGSDSFARPRERTFTVSKEDVDAVKSLMSSK